MSENYLDFFHFDPFYMATIALGMVLVTINLLVRFGTSLGLPLLSILLLIGYVIGPQGINIIPSPSAEWKGIITNLSLTLVGLLVGNKLFTLKFDRKTLSVATLLIAVTVLFVFIPIAWLSGSVVFALLIGIIGSFTAPTHTIAIIGETHTKSPFGNYLLKIVIYGEVLVLLAFSFALYFLKEKNVESSSMSLVLSVMVPLVVDILIGLLVSIPTVYMCRLMGRERFKIPEALGIVLFVSGVSLVLKSSPLFLSVLVGYILARGTQNRIGTLNDIKNIEWIIFTPFFLIAGGSLEFNMIYQLGLLGAAFIVFRILGRLFGAWVSEKFFCKGQFSPPYKLGLSLLPQGGVAIGTVWISQGILPEETYKMLVATIIGSTVFFEIIGPILLRRMLTAPR